MILTVSIFLCLAAATVLSMGYSITCDEQKHLDTENEKLYVKNNFFIKSLEFKPLSRCRKLKLPDTHIDYGYRLLFIEVNIYMFMSSEQHCNICIELCMTNLKMASTLELINRNKTL